jgi:hypothetical protein
LFDRGFNELIASADMLSPGFSFCLELHPELQPFLPLDGPMTADREARCEKRQVELCCLTSRRGPICYLKISPLACNLPHNPKNQWSIPCQHMLICRTIVSNLAQNRHLFLFSISTTIKRNIRKQ